MGRKPLGKTRRLDRQKSILNISHITCVALGLLVSSLVKINSKTIASEYSTAIGPKSAVQTKDAGLVGGKAWGGAPP